LAKTDEGEFELILGNKQLISVFLIVVVLLGVFFSMGYIVGRNSAAPSAEAARTTARQAPVESPPAETQQSAPAPSSDSPEAAANPADNNVIPPAGTTETKPEQPAPKKPAPTETTQAPAAKSKPSAVGPKAATQPKTETAKQAAAPPSPPVQHPGSRPTPAGEIAHGQYWQVVATTRPGAEVISEVLAKRGFHTAITPASRQGFFRVIVGPFQDAAAQAEARTKLEAAGFKNPINQRY